MKHILLFLSLLMAFVSFAAPARKFIEDGGSGPYKAIAVSEPSLPGFVIYRPVDLSGAVTREGQLPLMIFGNGACNDTSVPYENMLNDLASYGYIAISIGEMQDSINDREIGQTLASDMIKALDWAETAAKDDSSEYYGIIDMEYVALSGHSCGGAQALFNCGDPRVKTCIMFNSGMGDIEMAGASTRSLESLHGPILYVTGGESDIAHRNALIDYERITDVPVAFAVQVNAGHGGTFGDPHGGSYGRLLRSWLGWQFKDQRAEIDLFLRNRLNGYPDYTMKAKNFPDSNDPFTVKEINCNTRDGKIIRGQAYIPNTGVERKPTVVMAHGFNSSYLEPRPYAESLAMRGVASYIFDFCGGGNNSRSDGVTTDMTIFTEVENVEDIARQVKTWEFVDSSRVALLGCSQGGLVAVMTAAANPDMFKDLILVYPALMIPDTAPRMLERFDAVGNDTLEVMGMKLGRRYYESINGLSVLDTIGAFKGKVFMVYGDDDPVVAGGTLEKAAAVYSDSETLIVPGGQHGFPDYRHHEQATEGIIRFVLKNLTPPREHPRFSFDPADPDVHDPVMAWENGRCYLFTTGMGIGMMSSDDMIEWKPEKAPLDPIPSWPSGPVPAYQGHTWAPDIIKVGDKWYLYYSCSTFYKNISAIGVAVNSTLDTESPHYKWEDLGMVIMSKPGVDDFNAIDPNIIIDRKGNPWMTFGSFWDGIQIVRLKKDMKTLAGKPKTIARRRRPETVAHFQETANNNAIEAPFIIYRDGWYYLFASHDFCCKGLSSNYKTVVGRSRDVDGPYLDRNGKDMAMTGGTLLVGESERYSGVGHCSVYEHDGQWYIAAHGYEKSKNGASKLFLRRLNWKDGWPVIVD